MTETELEPGHGSASTSWDEAFAALKSRFPRVKDSIVYCIHAHQTNPNISLDDLKAQAAMHGLRVTGASVAAAQRLMTGAPPRVRKPRAVHSGTPVLTSSITPTATLTVATYERPERRARQWRPHVDVAGMVQETIAKLQRDGGTEAARLREALRQALALVQEALG